MDGFLVDERSEFERVGFVQLSTLVILDERLSNKDIRLYLYLKSYARFSDHCNPSVTRICRELCMSNKTAYAALNNLEKLGFISKEQSAGIGYVMTYWIEPLQKIYCVGEHYERIKPEIIESLRKRGMHKFVQYILTKDEEKHIEDTADADAVIDALAEVAEKEEEAKARAEKNKEVRDRRRNEYKKAKAKKKLEEGTKEKEPNVNFIEKKFRAKIKENWGDIPAAGKWQGKEYGIAKKLISKYGGFVVLDSVEKIIDQWEEIQSRYNIEGYPTIGTISYFSATWFSEAQVGKKEPKPKGKGKRRAALRQGEYNGKGKSVDYL
ncbi:hypothetical protein GF374_03455 [Candidatus Woesearchaeota archaeon]|nr:hypothetical protein [Candidatus Woesearchaeota archaeon]